jgi:hypothetical protein
MRRVASTARVTLSSATMRIGTSRTDSSFSSGNGSSRNAI